MDKKTYFEKILDHVENTRMILYNKIESGPIKFKCFKKQTERMKDPNKIFGHGEKTLVLEGIDIGPIEKPRN